MEAEAEAEAESEAEVGSLLHAVAAAGGLAHGINSEPVRADGAADDAGGYDRGDRLRSGDPHRRRAGGGARAVTVADVRRWRGGHHRDHDRLGHLRVRRHGDHRGGLARRGAALLAWIVAAVLVVMGSFCYGELAVQMPSASGDAEYLRPC